MEMAPIVNGLETEFEGKMSVIQLNAAVEANEKLQNQWGLRGHPTFALVDANDSVVQLLFGPQPEAVLREAMEPLVVQ
jgi:protein-disulfide isomerase-like protein with CxxC motif